MTSFGGVRRLLRLRVRRKDVEHEIDDEIATHLAMRIDWLVPRGMPRDDAERQARRRFGDLEQARCRLRASAAVRKDRMKLREWVDSVRDDARYALRQIRRAPGFAAPPGARETAPQIALWLLAMAGVVPLIACGNVTNLFLARAAGRRTEIAVRSSLGASRSRLVRQLLVDTGVLVALGGLLGLVIGVLGDRVIRSLLLPGSVDQGSFIDHRLLVFGLVVTTAAALLACLSPALAASRLELTDVLKNNARAGNRTFHRSHVRDAMVPVQAALSVVLLIGAGLFVRSLRNVLAIDLGFDALHLAIATVNFSNTAFTPAEVDSYYHAAAERLRRVTGVQGTALATAKRWRASSGQARTPWAHA